MTSSSDTHPTDGELTAQQAADLLNVSRRYVIDLVDRGLLPSRRDGDDRMLPLKDVLAHKRDRETKRRHALQELAALDQELGLR